jgi:cytochrome P450
MVHFSAKMLLRVLMSPCVIKQKILSVALEVEKTEDYHGFDWLVTNRGLINAHPDIWKGYRDKLNKLFKYSNVQDFLTIFNHHSKNLVKALRTKADEGIEFDYTWILTKFTLDCIIGNKNVNLI